MQSDRHEVEALTGTQYEEKVIKATKDLITTEAQRDAATGATLSPAAMAIALQSDKHAATKCPWCSQPKAYFDHVAWQCDKRPGEPPQEPKHPMQKRFGWAYSDNKKYNKEVIEWLGNTVEKYWEQRHGVNFEEKKQRIAKAREEKPKKPPYPQGCRESHMAELFNGRGI